MERRHFLKNLSVVLSSPVIINSLPVRLMAGTNPLLQAAATLDNDKAMVIVQLHGGNDGINTLIPIDQYSLYYNRRANIAVPDFGSRSYISLDSTVKDRQKVGVHPDMISFKNMYDQGTLSIVNGVSYESNNGSHFRGRDIMFMGGNYNDFLSSGFGGRYLDQIYPNYPSAYPSTSMPDPLALEIGDDVSLLFTRDNGIPVSVSIFDPEQFFALVDNLQGFKDKDNIDPRGIPPTSITNSPYGTELKYILDLEEKSNDYATQLKKTFDKGANTKSVVYPNVYPFNAPSGSLRNPLSYQLKLIARLLSGGSKTKIFLVRIGGFDNHANQVETYDPTQGVHAALLYHLSTALKAFQDDLKGLGLDDRVVTVTTSEFGRRIDSNGSYGTDHGTAFPVFVLGKNVKPGIVGNNPDLSTSSSNISMQYDYRQIYTAILKDFMGATDAVIEKTFKDSFLNTRVPIINTNNVVTGTEGNFFENRFRLNNCFPNPANDVTTFSFYLNTKTNVNLGIYNLQGQLVKMVAEGTKDVGLHEIQFNLKDLGAGTYIYKIKAASLEESKKLIIVK
jgi:uncharacterized protein (DUF1501 family)